MCLQVDKEQTTQRAPQSLIIYEQLIINLRLQEWSAALPCNTKGEEEASIGKIIRSSVQLT